VTRTHARIASVAGIALVLTAIGTPAALAHEERTVGKYHFAVGFGSEPAYAGYPNSAQLLLADASDKPVTDLGDTVKVQVRQGTAQTTLSLEPDFEVGEFGTPGDYRAWFIPTAAGAYTFHFTGTIHGQRISQSFTSSPTTFDVVQDATGVEFPAKAPTTQQLSQRIDREVPRLATVKKANAISNRADHARTLGIIGVALGAVGLALGALALRRRRG
jgi:hypothetical protein